MVKMLAFKMMSILPQLKKIIWSGGFHWLLNCSLASIHTVITYSLGRPATQELALDNKVPSPFWGDKEKLGLVLGSSKSLELFRIRPGETCLEPVAISSSPWAQSIGIGPEVKGKCDTACKIRNQIHETHPFPLRSY